MSVLNNSILMMLNICVYYDFISLKGTFFIIGKVPISFTSYVDFSMINSNSISIDK